MNKELDEMREKMLGLGDKVKVPDGRVGKIIGYGARPMKSRLFKVRFESEEWFSKSDLALIEKGEFELPF